MAQTLEMEQLVRELNNPRNQSAPEVIDLIQKRIQRLQREPPAWQMGIDLLSHDEAVMRFYGALTLTIKINADWDADKVGEDRDLVNHLLESLVSSYVRLAAIPDVPFVLQKLCTTLVSVFQKPQSAWALPVRHLTACTVANQYVPQDVVPELGISLASDTSISGAQLRSLLMFPMTLAEQETAISGSTREQGVRVRISNNIPDILKLVHFTATGLNSDKSEVLHTFPVPYLLSVNYDNFQFLDTARTMLQLVPLWTGDVKVKGARQEGGNAETKFDLFQATVHSFPRLFEKEELTSAVLQAFTALEESSHKLLQHALPGYEAHVINSPHATSWVAQLISGDFDPDAVAYVNFLEACMSQVDVTSPDYLATGFYIEILKQVRTLLHCEGAPGVDDTVCQVALEILTSVTEGFGDWPEPSPYDDSMRGLVGAACSSALNKIRVPREELSTRTQTWDADDRAKFQDFRYDVQDYLQNAFSILGERLIEEIIKSIIEQKSILEWDLFEAGLFSLLSFSDAISNEPERFDKYIYAVFDSANWNAGIHIDADVPDRVRQVMIKTVGENTVFLQRHTNFLIPCLNFLFTSLHMESSSTAASRAIYTLCDAQRAMLTEALPQFMESLGNTSDIEVDAKHRIHAAVGAIIQALPSEVAKVQPLTQITHQLITQVQTEIDLSIPHAEFITKAIDILQTASSLGRGLRAPSDTAIDLEKSENTESQFWIDGPGSIVQQQIIHIHNTLLKASDGHDDPSFIEAACSFLRAGFTEEHPSPFKFVNSKILDLLSPYLQTNSPLPDQVMSTASSYLASVKPTDADNEFATLIMMSIRTVNDTLVNHKSKSQPLNSEFCAASLEFYARLLPKWASSLLHLSESPEILNVIIEVALLLIQDSDTLPRRAAASFMTAFFEASSQSSITSNPGLSSTMNTTLQNFAPRMIAATVHLLGGACARSDIDALAETIKKSIQKQPLMASKLLKEVMKDESAVLTPRALQATKPEQRARFAAQIEMLRGQRKTNEVIREFWIACKGRDFEYVV